MLLLSQGLDTGIMSWCPPQKLGLVQGLFMQRACLDRAPVLPAYSTAHLVRISGTVPLQNICLYCQHSAL